MNIAEQFTAPIALLPTYNQPNGLTPPPAVHQQPVSKQLHFKQLKPTSDLENIIIANPEYLTDMA